jgi:hypothetical protein
MKIIVTDLSGKRVDEIMTEPYRLQSDVEKVKAKYPPGEFHASLETF